MENALDKRVYRIYTLEIKELVLAATIKENESMLEKMQEMLADQLNCDAETITPDTSFKDDLGADSLDLFELVMALEDEYNVEIPSEDLTELNTVGDVIEYMRTKGVEA
jgi:acyl carrier protein